MTQGLVSNVSGDVLVILDLRLDESLYEAGVAREVYFKLLGLTFNYVITHFNHCQEQNCRSSTSLVLPHEIYFIWKGYKIACLSYFITYTIMYQWNSFPFHHILILKWRPLNLFILFINPPIKLKEVFLWTDIGEGMCDAL
jgi:hypothetical protein